MKTNRWHKAIKWLGSDTGLTALLMLMICAIFPQVLWVAFGGLMVLAALLAPFVVLGWALAYFVRRVEGEESGFF